MAEPAWPLQGELPSWPSTLSIVIAPAIAAPAALAIFPSNKQRADDVGVLPNIILAVWLPICAILLWDPIAATPMVSNKDRRKTRRISSFRISYRRFAANSFINMAYPTTGCGPQVMLTRPINNCMSQFCPQKSFGKLWRQLLNSKS